jgi:hypothetical protein
MKKYALAIIVVSTFAIVSTASAQVIGTWEMISFGSCIHSDQPFTTENVNGFDHYVPQGRIWGATTSAVGTWEFYANGKGKADIWNYPIDYPPGSDGIDSTWGPRARSQNLVWDTKWTRNKDVIVIKMFVPDGTFTQQKGEIVGSIDVLKQTIIIPTVLQQLSLGDPLYNAVCHTMRTFIRVGGIE